VPPGDRPPVNVVVDEGPVTTDATATVPLLHVPPATELLNVVIAPGHSVVVPDIALGAAEIVTVTEFVQPVAVDVNVITDVPVPPPPTRPPPGVTVATELLLLVHVPATELLNCVVPPTHVLVVPVMVGDERTVTLAVTEQPVPVE
jgi:hypothetical protein